MQTNQLIQLTVRPAATDFKTKLFVPGQKTSLRVTKLDTSVDIRAAVFKSLNHNEFKLVAKTGRESVVGIKFTGADHLIFKNQKKQQQHTYTHTGEVIWLLIGKEQEAGMK